MARLAALIVAFSVTASAVVSAGQSTVKRPKGSTTRAAEWVDAVLAHEPGTRDAPSRLVSSWPANVVVDVLIDLSSLRRLMGDPHTRFFPVPIEFDGGRAREILYSGDERDELVQAGIRVLRKGLTDGDLIARAIVLHTDIALLQNLTGDLLLFKDGQHMDLERGPVDHLETARMLGDMLDKKIDRNADLALWYRATMAMLASRGKWNTAHTERALALFPDDSELRFLAGCQHETFASARTQSSIPNTSLPPGMRIPVGSPSRELNEAASDLKRALDSNPLHTEARLHYGRVLTLIGRPANAVSELRRAASEARDPILGYYAQLFLGAALEANNQRDAAAEAYRAAAQITPKAQAPRLALSQLAAMSGNRAAASAALEPMLTLSADGNEQRDPWWKYVTSYAHDADSLMVQAHQRLATPKGRVAR